MDQTERFYARNLPPSKEMAKSLQSFGSGGASMDDWEFQDALNKLYEDHKRFIAIIERMPPLSDEQKQKISEMLVRQSQDYDQINSKGEIARRAWKAARHAAQGADLNREEAQERQHGARRFMLIALIVVGAILLLLRFVFR